MILLRYVSLYYASELLIYWYARLNLPTTVPERNRDPEQASVQQTKRTNHWRERLTGTRLIA